MITSIPKELESFLEQCQRIVNNRFWFCSCFEFRYMVLDPSNDDSEIQLYVGVEDRVMITSFKLSTICSECNECFNSFVSLVDKYDSFLANTVEIKNG